MNAEEYVNKITKLLDVKRNDINRQLKSRKLSKSNDELIYDRVKLFSYKLISTDKMLVPKDRIFKLRKLIEITVHTEGSKIMKKYKGLSQEEKLNNLNLELEIKNACSIERMLFLNFPLLDYSKYKDN